MLEIIYLRKILLADFEKKSDYAATDQQFHIYVIYLQTILKDDIPLKEQKKTCKK